MRRLLKRLRDVMTRCDGYCNLGSFDAADAYTYYGTGEDAMELAARCYHKNRPPYPGERLDV